MYKRNAVLLSIFAVVSSLSATDTSSIVSLTIPWESSWTADQIAHWAAANSAAANLLESERSALATSIDDNDSKQRAQASLAQKVLRDLACHERERTAAQALTNYHQLTGLQNQKSLLDQADRTLEQLLRMEAKAEELNLKDGNRSELENQRYQIADQQAEAVGANSKLRIVLGDLIGKSSDELDNAQFAAWTGNEENSLSLDESIAIALSRRCDLQAIETLCRSLNADSLPAARQLLGAIQPGLGMAIAVATRKPLLAALHHDNNSAAELCQRREQCDQLRAERQSQIEVQVRLAFIEQNTAIARLSIAQQQAEQVSQLTRQSVIAIELDQAKPGTDLLATLEQLQAQGRVIERQTAVSLAATKLHEAMGTIIAD